MNERNKTIMTTNLSVEGLAQPLAVTTPQNVSAVITTFASCQDVRPSSRELYTKTVQLFFEWVAVSGRSIDTLTVADVIAYKEHLLSIGKSPLTVASYVNSIRRFYEWAEANKYYPNIAKAVHAPKRKQEFRKRPLSVNQTRKLLAEEQTASPRDNAMLTLLAYTGLRCIEVVRANVGDITFIGENNQRVLMVQGKGHDTKDDFVILTDTVYNAIKAYLATRRDLTDQSPLFASESHTNKGGRMTTRAVSGIAKGALKGIGLDSKYFTAHSLRHTAVSNIIRAGGSLEQAQGMARHASIATTQIYARMGLEEQRLRNSGEALLDRLYNA